MAYVIQGIIADNELLSQQSIPQVHVIPLPQGKSLIPLTEELRRLHDIPAIPFTDEGAEPVPGGVESIAKLCRPLSLKGKVAYIEAEIFGGRGLQASLLFEGGELLGKIKVGERAINQALIFLGVVKGESDEFDALGLGAHRDTEEWIKK